MNTTWNDGPLFEPPPGSARCSGCGALVNLQQVLPAAGWRIIHRCSTRRIETIAVTEGDPPWAWREVAAAEPRRQKDLA